MAITLRSLYEILQDDKTDAAITAALENVCNVLPVDTNQCKNFIDQYADQLFHIIKENVTPDKICQLLGLCAPSTPIKLNDNCAFCTVLASWLVEELKVCNVLRCMKCLISCLFRVISLLTSLGDCFPICFPVYTYQPSQKHTIFYSLQQLSTRYSNCVLLPCDTYDLGQQDRASNPGWDGKGVHRSSCRCQRLQETCRRVCNTAVRLHPERSDRRRNLPGTRTLRYPCTTRAKTRRWLHHMHDDYWLRSRCY